MDEDELLTRYKVDRSPRDFALLVEKYRPLVYSVCRRYLRHPEDVDDAAQETFLKLSHHLASIHGSIFAWLTATAYSSSVDLIRRSVREQRRCESLGRMGSPDLERRLVHEAIQSRLGAALLALDEPSRQLLIARIFRKTPLRVIAGQQQTSVATISRRVTRALADLAAVLKDMGIAAADDLTLAEHFDGLVQEVEGLDAGGQGLRFAADWRAPAMASAGQQTLSLKATCLPGWSRPIRIGALVSHLSLTIVGYRGIRLQAEEQIRTTCLLGLPGFQLIGIAEHGTTEYGPIERTLRDHELTAGLIAAEDAESLKTLDVILLGVNFAMTRQVASAFLEAVNSGVGLLNEFWTGSRTDNEYILPLMLADSPYYAFHTPPPCGSILLPATVLQEHPVLPGLTPGMPLSVVGCGPLYRVSPGAKVLIAKDLVISPEQHGIPGLGPARMPYYIVGQIGRGRVVVIWEYAHERVSCHPALGKGYWTNLLAWLAEPHRELP